MTFPFQGIIQWKINFVAASGHCSTSLLLLLSHCDFSSGFSLATTSSGLHYIGYITTTWTVVCPTSSDSLHMKFHIYCPNPANVSLRVLSRGWKTCFSRHLFFVRRWYGDKVQQWLLWRTNVRLYGRMISPPVWNKHAAGIRLISRRGRRICGLPFILLAWHKEHAAFMKTWKALSEPERIYYMLLRKLEPSDYLDASAACAFQFSLQAKRDIFRRESSSYFKYSFTAHT